MIYLLYIILSQVQGFEYLSAIVHSRDVSSIPYRKLWHPHLYLAKDTSGEHYEVRHSSNYYDVSISFLQQSNAPGVLNCECRFVMEQVQQEDNSAFLQVMTPKKNKPTIKSKEKEISIGTAGPRTDKSERRPRGRAEESEYKYKPVYAKDEETPSHSKTKTEPVNAHKPAVEYLQSEKDDLEPEHQPRPVPDYYSQRAEYARPGEKSFEDYPKERAKTEPRDRRSGPGHTKANYKPEFEPEYEPEDTYHPIVERKPRVDHNSYSERKSDPIEYDETADYDVRPDYNTRKNTHNTQDQYDDVANYEPPDYDQDYAPDYDPRFEYSSDSEYYNYRPRQKVPYIEHKTYTDYEEPYADDRDNDYNEPYRSKKYEEDYIPTYEYRHSNEYYPRTPSRAAPNTPQSHAYPYKGKL